ncbi:peptidoglycan/LPS O-acetylase OafA/YrhL [Nitrospirillum amazonense]|uniref:Peptidoglycan/LPS O-acetylase OafA/YrhL n=1 Tax=Nitrospirillum amazonense TaxID=28077 RepID=A0A560FTP0_9PROT|nr:acyltransferase family protein [Nitrospirillum amazonense]TWB24870.1 peptidoglycan/LPS O-acetylase OafA/YrhL [Nitrospirillum amazonense]
MSLSYRSPAFRNDIEGLRGIAVLSVLLFHLQISVFSGGYIGVDIFYTISGYLITRNISSEIDEQKFTFANFYLRRLHRLFPAAFFVTATSFVAASIIFPPIYLTKMSGEAIYSISGLANIYYWLQSGYFDVSSIQKPLLHMWSLGVEEQFYLLWPAFMVLISKFNENARALIIGAVAILSLLACTIVMASHPVTAFFLTPFRIYEFAIGAGLAVLKTKLPRLIHSLSCIVGLLLIAVSIFLYTEHTSFPGLHALIPTMGAALIIFSRGGGLSGRVLDNAPIRWIGRISYSLYLVHWPLIVFANYVHGDIDSFFCKFLLLGFSLLSGYLLHHFVEIRFFIRKSKPTKNSNAFVLCCMFCIMAFTPIAADAWASGGWKWRISEKLSALNQTTKEEYDRYLFSHNGLYSRTQFNSSRPNVLIVGDSQAADFLNMMVESGLGNAANIRILPIITQCGTLIVNKAERKHFLESVNPPSASSTALREECEKKQEEFENDPHVQEANVVFVVGLWSDFQIPYLKETVDTLTAKTKADIFVVGRKTQKESSIDLVNKIGSFDGIEKQSALYNQLPSVRAINRQLENFWPTKFIDIIDYICPAADYCHVLTEDKKAIFYDATHLSKDGAQFLGKKMANDLTKKIFSNSICSQGIIFQNEEAWHACESDGRWLKDMGTVLQIPDAKGARSISMTGRFYAYPRKIIIFANGDIIYSNTIDGSETHPVTINAVLPSPLQQDKLTLKLDFEGPAPTSPVTLQQSDDGRTLNFFLQDLKILR